MASVLMHIETVNIKFLNDIVWSIEVGDNLEDRLDTKRKVKENTPYTKDCINGYKSYFTVGWLVCWFEDRLRYLSKTRNIVVFSLSKAWQYLIYFCAIVVIDICYYISYII